MTKSAKGPEIQAPFAVLVGHPMPPLPRKVYPQGENGPAYYVAADVDAVLAALLTQWEWEATQAYSIGEPSAFWHAIADLKGVPRE